MSQRMEFVTRRAGGESMASLCREFGISRELGYRLWRRFQQEGPQGLYDRRRAPIRQPLRTSPEVEALIVEARKEHGWGARKLRALLLRENSGVRIPSTSTVHEILKRQGLVEPRKRRRRVPRDEKPLQSPEGPNELWCIDFKGQFRLGNRRYCYPLTITDSFSRSILACEALSSTESAPAKVVVDRTFRRFGLPRRIRTDNGTPFASRALAGLSRLSVCWWAQGVVHERIDPGHPEQNGRHERMHRTLKAATTRPAGRNLLQQQDRFDQFVEKFNEVRPHEALEDKTPASQYAPSTRVFSPDPTPDYPLADLTVTVGPDGRFWMPKHVLGVGLRILTTSVLEGQTLALRELEDGTWLVRFAALDLGRIDLDHGRVVPTPPKGDS